MRRRTIAIVLAVLVLIVLPAAVIGLQFVREPVEEMANPPVADAVGQVARGAYLARAGNCMACHTARGGAEYAGGRAISTPFGDVFASNITPDARTGIGAWTPDDFWRALHHGKSRDGRLLYPAFPYPNYTKVTRGDADALFAYLKTIPAVSQPNRVHALRFPYDRQIMLAGWRALYFRAGTFEPVSERSAEWNRGAYLVQGLGHCSACHAPRNRLGAALDAETLAGALMPGAGWYAPSLQPAAGAAERDSNEALHSLLKTGVSERGAIFGPMAEVVRHSLQHLSNADIAAMTGYLTSLPPQTAVPAVSAERTADQRSVLKLGGALYEEHCAECHGANGEGKPSQYPALAGNRSMTSAESVNAIKMVLNGGYPPSTAGNPMPFGMPPYGPLLSDAEVAAVVSYIATSWGNTGEVTSTLQVARHRGVPID